jgi:hypothetical protein
MVEKKVAKKRSWMLAGAIVAGVAVLLITIKSVGKGDRNTDPDPNPI